MAWTVGGICRGGGARRVALSATALELSGVLSVLGGAAGAAGSGRATGARFGRAPPERPLGGGAVTTTRGSSVLSVGCAVSAALGPAVSSATGSKVSDDTVNDECVIVRMR